MWSILRLLIFLFISSISSFNSLFSLMSLSLSSSSLLKFNDKMSRRFMICSNFVSVFLFEISRSITRVARISCFNKSSWFSLLLLFGKKTLWTSLLLVIGRKQVGHSSLLIIKTCVFIDSLICNFNLLQYAFVQALSAKNMTTQ